MKKLLALILVFVMLLSLCGCDVANPVVEELNPVVEGKINETLTSEDISIKVTTKFGKGENLLEGELLDFKNHYAGRYDIGKVLAIEIEIDNMSKDTLYLNTDDVIVEYADGYKYQIDFDVHSLCSDVWMYHMDPLTEETHYWAVEIPQKVIDSDEPILIHFSPEIYDVENSRVNPDGPKFTIKYR